MRPRPEIRATIHRTSGPRDTLRRTIELIGQGIKAGARHLPLRLHVADLAARAPGRKDYRAQLAAIFGDFLARWRYVRDPLGLETVTTDGPAIWGLTWGGATGRGHGDCDDATVALGAAARAIGLPVRIVTMTSPGRRWPGHVYPEIHVPRVGWVAADAVAFPRGGLGYAPPASNRQRWTLEGKAFPCPQGEGCAMSNNVETWEGVGLEAFGLAGEDDETPIAWDRNVVRGFGSLADTFGIQDSPGLLAEVDPLVDGYARTPMIELGLADFQYVARTGRPRLGMVGIGDDGSVYQYQDIGFGGFFKKLFRGARKLVKKAVGFGKKLIKKLPGGKYLVRIGEKLHKTAMKMVRPLAKFVGKYASKLAPVAALIPGFGPAIAAGLWSAGKITKALDAAGVFSEGGKIKDKKTGKPITGSKLKAIQANVKRLADQERAKKKSGVLPAGSPEARAKLREKGMQLGPATLRRKRAA